MGLVGEKKPANGEAGVEKRETIHDKVYLAVRGELMTGTLQPGQSVSIRQLVEKFGISATPAREVLARLQAERALIVGPNRTPSVPHPSPNDLRDIRDVRIALEGLATEKAARCISEQELDELDAHSADMYGAIRANDKRAFLQSNWAFHRVIYRAAQSDLLIDIIETLWMRAGPMIRLALPGERQMRQYMEHHNRALEALRRGDALVARAAIELDIGSAAARLEETLPE